MTINVKRRMKDLRGSIKYVERLLRDDQRLLKDSVREFEIAVELFSIAGDWKKPRCSIEECLANITYAQKRIAKHELMLAECRDEYDELSSKVCESYRDDGYRFMDDMDIYHVIITKGFINGTKL